MLYKNRGCSGLKTIIVNEGNKNYSSIDGVLFDKDVKSLIKYPARKTETQYTIPNSVTSIGYDAFSGCSGLTSVTIPNSVTSIGYHAFEYCSGLTSVTIPNSVTSIGYEAFSGCSGLTSVTIPNSVTSIGLVAFYGCSGLKTLNLDCSLSGLNFSSSYISELYIGDNAETVYPLKNNSSLTKVVLGKNVNYLSEEAFKGSSKLKEFYVTGEEPPYCNPNVFQDASLSSATLYVPEAKAAYYQSTAPWSGFGTIKTLAGDTPQIPQCATPTIAYNGEKITFACATNGATIHYSVTIPHRAYFRNAKIFVPLHS